MVGATSYDARLSDCDKNPTLTLEKPDSSNKPLDSDFFPQGGIN